MISSWLKPVKLKEVIPIVNGLFSHIPDATYEFKCDVTKAQLDYLLLANYSQKTTSPVVDMMHEDERAMLSNSELTALASMMLNYYKPKWDKLGEVYDLEYDPVHNYLDDWEDEMDQSTAGSSSMDRTSTDTLNYGTSHNNTRTDNLTEETTYGKVNTESFTNFKERTDYNSGSTHTINSENPMKEETTYGKTNTESFTNYKEKTDYHSGTAHLIDAQNPVKEEIDYGKDDLRTDNLTKSNSGEESTINTGSTTNAVWGFNSSNAVNSDQSTDNNKTSRHVIGNGQGGNLLEENETGWQRHTLSGKDTKTNTGKYTDDKTGYDEVTKTGSKADTLSGKDTTINTGEFSDDKSGYDETSKSGSKADTLSGKDTVKNTGSQTDVGADSTTGTNSRVVDDDRTQSESIDRNRNGRHFGNIGNITSQSMIKEEIELWKWNYVQTILEDARDFLTIPIYV